MPNQELLNHEKTPSSDLKRLYIFHVDQIPIRFTGIVHFVSGTIQYLHEGILHREDGPTIIWQSGTQEWYKNGKLHREDGPAIIWRDGFGQWYYEGKLHRLDGPAIEETSQQPGMYAIHGKTFSKSEFERISKRLKDLDQIAEILQNSLEPFEGFEEIVLISNPSYRVFMFLVKTTKECKYTLPFEDFFQVPIMVVRGKVRTSLLTEE